MTGAYLLVAALLGAPPAAPAPVRPLALALPRVSFQEAKSPVAPFGPSAVALPHRFFDNTNRYLTLAETSGLLADAATTQRALHRFPHAMREGDPLARPFVRRGWPGEIAAGTLVVAADVGLRYTLHRLNHHRIERWVPLVMGGEGVTNAIHNTLLMNHIAIQVAAGLGPASVR